jgi:hypothetical protein
VAADRFDGAPSRPLAGGVYFGYLSGKSDEEGTEICETKCAEHVGCTAYTFLSNFHWSITWKGECLGRTDGLTDSSPDDNAFSGTKNACGDEAGQLLHQSNG